MRKPIELKRVLDILGDRVIRTIGPTDLKITHPAPIDEAEGEQAITFCSKSDSEALNLVRSTRAGVVLCEDRPWLKELANSGKPATMIVVKDSRMSFIRLLEEMFGEPSPRGIHPTAVVDEDAVIQEDVFVGANCSVGKSTIGQGTRIYPGVHIYDSVSIGRNVVIHSGCVIGSDGFGFQRTETGQVKRFPHTGSVVIEDDVELQAACHVSRGALGRTVIKRGSKFDSGCHVAHNVRIGESCLVAAHAMIAGSVKVGDHVWIGPGALISDGLKIGDRAFITVGAVVTRDVGPDQKVTGNFAIDHDKFLSFLKKIR